MKNVKFAFIAVLAVILTIAASSFKMQQPTNQKWFVYSGSGDPATASNYTVAPNNGADPQCHEDAPVVCAVLATDDGNGHPVQTELTSIADDSNDFQDPIPGLLEYRNQ